MTSSNNTVKYTIFSNNGTKAMTVGSLDGKEDGVHNGDGFVKISRIYVTDTFIIMDRWLSASCS